MFKKPSSMKTLSLAAAMTAAMMLGSAVHAQNSPTEKPGDSGTPTTQGTNAKTPEQRDAAKADKQAAKADKKQAKAAKRAARKDNAGAAGTAPTDAGGSTR